MTCRYDKTHGYLQPTHWPSCRVPECAGCLPCEERHCTAREGCIGHLDDSMPLTCARCVNRVRTSIRRIEALSALMLPAAMEAGEHDPEREEAAYLAGPAADPRKVSARRVTLMRAIDSLPKEAAAKARAAIPDEDPWHPYAVLGRWDMMLREDYDQPTMLKVTISRSADYLVGLLERLAQDDEQDFAHFASEMRACATHLESVLDTLVRIERGAPCPECAASATETALGDAQGSDVSPNATNVILSPENGFQARAPRLAKIYGQHAAHDRWQCPRVEAHWWSDADYRLRVSDDFLANAEWLTMSDLARRIAGISSVNVRKWAERKEVRKRLDSGRIVYAVADVATRHAEFLARKP